MLVIAEKKAIKYLFRNAYNRIVIIATNII
jgi:hypothetical protein